MVRRIILACRTIPTSMEAAREAIDRLRSPQRRLRRIHGQYDAFARTGARTWLNSSIWNTSILYPTGYAAGAGVIRGLVRSSDHIVMDALAHACLQDGAAAATNNVYLHRHLDCDSARRWLKKIREKDTENGILVVTEGLFSMDSDTPQHQGAA